MKTIKTLFLIYVFPFYKYAQQQELAKQHFRDSVLVQTSDTTKPCYIQLYHGEKMYGSEITYELNLFKDNYIYLDGLKINSNQIRYYQNSKGYFANVGGHFAKRDIIGKIKVYKYETARDVYWYYEIENKNIKSLNYSNLSNDLSNDANFLKDLKKIRKRQNITRVCLTAGGIALIAGLFIIPGPSTAAVILRSTCAIGGVTLLTFGLTSFPVDYIKVIELYNKTNK